jgi:hypothetical protein
MLSKLNTIIGATETSEGIIPHKKHAAGFDMPVKLDVKNTIGVKPILEPQRPKRDKNGNLVYAMPGGLNYSDS